LIDVILIKLTPLQNLPQHTPGLLLYFNSAVHFGGVAAVALKMQVEHFEVSLQATQTFSALMFCGRQITNASIAFPILLSIAHARRRIATAASSERLGPYIFFILLFNKLFKESFSFSYSIADITVFNIFVVICYVRERKTVYNVAGYVNIVIFNFSHD
jgi:hypothetical protein